MNDNELRDRIADILEELDGMDLDRQAQAIIDDLGLTVETINPHRDKFTEAERERYGIRPESRIAGKWEKQ